MESVVTRGLVLRSSDYLDNDRIITVLTEDKGKMTVTVKGAKSVRSRYLAGADQFCYSNFTFRKTKKYFHLTECDLIEDFYVLREDIVKVALASYFCQIAEEMSPEGIEDTEFLKLTLNALYALANDRCGMGVLKAAFEFKSAVLAGFMPELSDCAVCEGDMGEYFLDFKNGRLICRNCISTLDGSEIGEGNTFFPVSSAVVCALRFVASSPIQRFICFRLHDDEIPAFCALSEKYLTYHVEKYYPTLEFYNSLI